MMDLALLGPIVANGIKLANEILKRRQPKMAKELIEHSLEKVSIIEKIEAIHRLPPQDRNCAELEDLYAANKAIDARIAIYQQAALVEAVSS